jgi:Mn2+/Fe2+ NRAMP family transporter
MAESGDLSQITPGTRVEADGADLGDHDLGEAIVKGEVPNPETGEPALAVEAGGVFRKEIIVPADRIEGEENGHVVIDLDEGDVEQLSSFGTSILPPRTEERRDFLSGLVPDPPEQASAHAGSHARDLPPAERARRQEEADARPITVSSAFRALGPGIISGASDNDPTTVGTLAVVGSQTGFSLAWLLVLVLPMMASIQAIASAAGVTSGRDLQQLIRSRFGRAWAWVALIFLLAVNIFTLAADLEGGAAALGLLTHVDWRFFTAPLALGVAAVLFFGSYEWVRRILSGVVLVFVLYVPAAFLAHPDWGAVLRGSIIPHLAFNNNEIAGALALLGTTLTSYVYYWQSIEEVEQAGRRPRILAQLDAVSGMIVATAVFWFILISSGATLGVHHQQVQTAQQAAAALKPVAGAAAQYLFAAGLLASALLALPILAGTTAYAVGETLGWPVGLSRQPWRTQGFYLVLIAALVVVIPLTFLGIEPVTLLFISGIAGGVGTPLLLVLLLLVAGDMQLMHGRPISTGLKLLGWATTLIVSAATLIYLGSQFI